MLYLCCCALSHQVDGAFAVSDRLGELDEAAAIVEDSSPGKRVYDPSHPDADKQGYVTLPNVNPVTEMVDLIDSSRAYEHRKAGGIQRIDA